MEMTEVVGKRACFFGVLENQTLKVLEETEQANRTKPIARRRVAQFFANLNRNFMLIRLKRINLIRTILQLAVCPADFATAQLNRHRLQFFSSFLKTQLENLDLRMVLVSNFWLNCNLRCFDTIGWIVSIGYFRTATIFIMKVFKAKDSSVRRF